MATNRQAVKTTVTQKAVATFIDINKTVALISDTTTVTDLYALYTSMDDVDLDWTNTDEFYKMAEAYFAETGGSGYLYAVPVDGLDGADPDMSGKLTELENSDISFAMVVCDTTLRTSAHVIDGTLATDKYMKAYHMTFVTNEADAKTSATTDAASVNKAIYDALTGVDADRIGNMSFIYSSTATDYIDCKLAGIMMGQDIGSQTAKFKKPTGSSLETLTGAELQFLLDKNINVYTTANEVQGRGFLKEGTSLKDSNYIDTSLGAIWVEIQMNNACYDLLEANKVSIDDTGFALLTNAVTPIFTRGQRQGIIQSGTDRYTIEFTEDLDVTRGITGTYSFYEATAGHFVTNSVQIITAN